MIISVLFYFAKLKCQSYDKCLSCSVDMSIRSIRWLVRIVS